MSRLERSVASVRETESWTDDDDATWPPYARDFDLPRNPYKATIHLGGRRLADALGDLETLSQVQCLRIFATDGIATAGASVDLGDLSPLPLLRQVDVVRPASVTGRLTDGVEALEVLEGEVDLAALAGHPSLWSLTVEHGVRVDTVRLADLPGPPGTLALLPPARRPRRLPRPVPQRRASVGGEPHAGGPADFSMPRVAVAVRAGDEVLGSIWAAVKEPLKEDRMQALRDGARVVALRMLRIRAGADVERRLRADLVSTGWRAAWAPARRSAASASPTSRWRYWDSPYSNPPTRRYCGSIG